MQSDWTNNDQDWQLKKLQHDSIKTTEKVIEVLRETIEKEILVQGKDYERLFGSHSAQFAEYVTMVAQKLEQLGVLHEDVISWLNSAAADSSIPARQDSSAPADFANNPRSSQSITVPFIPSDPMHNFGDQSLFDNSLGTQAMVLPRPRGSKPGASTATAATAQAPAIISSDYSARGGNDSGTGNGHSHGPISTKGVPIPPFTPDSIPLKQPRSVLQSVVTETQEAILDLPPAHLQARSSQVQPQPSFDRSAAPAQSVPKPIPHAPNQLGPSTTARLDDKKEQDKYTFNPVTAWD